MKKRSSWALMATKRRSGFVVERKMRIAISLRLTARSLRMGLEHRWQLQTESLGYEPLCF